MPNASRAPAAPALELDLIGDLACPWTFVGKRSLDRALERLYGSPRVLRWHGLPLSPDARASWREHFASRLPRGASLTTVQRGLQETGEELGIAFHFDRLQLVPDTHEAHRLVRLAAREGRQALVIDALFRAFFEQGRDIADSAVLGEIAHDCHLDSDTRTAFADRGAGRGDVDAEERRMRGLGIAVVPNLLINGRVLVPGPADVSTYVEALDQALFPELNTPESRRLLH
ncbi:MAG TPA: DsbA family oxidoreductase [Steroidobacteraceae bacterium]|nr:DsbA family oxidoreductase [Steroidobacteraceae bacterium]